MKEIVLDTETTGISIKEGHRIVEIACIELDNQIPTGRKFNYCINPQRKVSEKAFKVHGYTDEFLLTQKKFVEIKDEFLSFIKDKTLIIHNSEFDLGHLNNELAICKEDHISNNVIDTLTLARDKFPGSQVSLDALCKRFRIDNTKRTKHNALLDCSLLAKVYINLIDQKEPSLNLENQNDSIDNSINNKIPYYKKIIQPSKEEIKKHREYIKTNLKKNFF
ncbi:DNA polymerase III subunit epsilon [Candidatus Pelagibacter communis]|uniref:DNA polymerase III subunit epsilon n=1 Tax=Pelagibacter ubique TaxID=198252 RepID=UPI00094C7DF6|nr:DNA polymerase III subunit epsilon [Candidatus Pelagibacter ubique]